MARFVLLYTVAQPPSRQGPDALGHYDPPLHDYRPDRRLEPVRLKAITLEQAEVEAEGHWERRPLLQDRRRKPIRGYWLVEVATGQIVKAVTAPGN